MATVDVDAILNMMPEKIKAEEQLKAFSTAKQAEIEKLATVWQADVEKYKAAAEKMTQPQREAKEAELTKTQQQIQQCHKQLKKI
jgi:outer membrane protein